jgi:DNA-directed RNA polymerase II subunit RPB2
MLQEQPIKAMSNDKPLDGINDLSTNEIFNLVNLMMNRKNMIFDHLYNSYNKFIDEDVYNYLYNNDHIITEIIGTTTVIKYRFKFENIRVQEPMLDNGIEPLFPSIARHHGLTYNLKIFADVTQYQDNTHIMTDVTTTKIVGTPEKNILVAIIPLMVRSKYCTLTRHKNVDKNECEYDPGGYFIVKGNEKCVICQDKPVENKPSVHMKKDVGLYVQVNSKSHRPDGMICPISVRFKKDGELIVKISIFHEVNVIILLKALGLGTDKDIVHCITQDEHDTDMINALRHTLEMCKNEKGNKISTQEEAIDFLMTKLKIMRKYSETDKEIKHTQRRLFLIDLFKKSLLPHLTGSVVKKAHYIAYMMNKLLRVYLKRGTVDDRDSYVNKRIDMPGDLIFELYKQQHKKMISECKRFFDNRNKSNETPINIINNIKPNIIEQGINGALTTGKWIKRQGVAQILQRLTYLYTISLLRRIDAPGSDASTMKLTTPRHLHPSSVGFLCCVETPEHAKIGLTKHLSMIGSISIMSRDQYLLIYEYLMKNVTPIEKFPTDKLRNYDTFKVLLNGDWLGYTTSYAELASNLNKMKLEGLFDPKNTSIVFDESENEIRVYCDSGRLHRPVLRVENNELVLKRRHIQEISLLKKDKTKITSWGDFMIKFPNVVEYIDVELQPYVVVADKINKIETNRKIMIDSISKIPTIKSQHRENRYDDMTYIKYSYCEFHPSLLLGEIVINIPFADKNAGARNIFQYAQGRQAMSIFATNYRNRMDISFILYKPQRSLVYPRGATFTNTRILPPGENCIVAIACYTGYNQEDSLIFNKTSIQRGKFRAMSVKKYILTVQKNQSTAQDDILTKPDISKVSNMKKGAYEKLNDKGYVEPETPVEYGDAIFGKITPVSTSIGGNTKPYRDTSEIYKVGAPGIVDKVYLDTSNQDGYETRKACIRSEREAKIGDKYCSQHGQKGTVGILLDAIDMPFTKNGIRPDIIVNPNAIPSRMTIGQLVECVVGKAMALQGMDGDGTPFEDHDLSHVEDILTKLGYDPKGTEEMYNGMTGEKMKVKIFIGPTYYQRLKHLVQDKIHSRARGPHTSLTRQAPEGRSRDGGLRLGEMERDALIAHGMAKMIKQKLMDNSDLYTTYICGKCGLFARRFESRDNKVYARKNDTYYCNSCKNYNDINKIQIPYAFKLLTQELMALNIAPRLRCNEARYN